MMAAGAAASKVAQDKSQKAQDEALDAERERQNNLAKESRTLAETQIAGAGQGQIDEANRGASELQIALDGNSNRAFNQLQPDSYVASSPKAIGDAFRSALDTAKQTVGNQLSGRAQLAGFNNMLSKSGIDYQNTARRQGQIGGFMQGSQNVLMNDELPAAARQGEGLATVGSLLSAGGGAYMGKMNNDALSNAIKTKK